MASSVLLKACGGLGPYSWEKTGNVTISDTTGPHVMVSVLEPCVDPTGATVTVTDNLGVSASYVF
jgi:hypothetical protein